MQIAYKHRWIHYSLLTVFFCLIGVSCSSRTEDGVVARVNGRPLSYFELEAQRNMLFSGFAQDGTPPPDDILAVQYRYALQQLLEQELVMQYLEEKKLLPDETVVQAEIDSIQGDYDTSNFSQVLLEEGISPKLWREAIRKKVLVTHFVDIVLRPKETILPEEIENYYTTHQKEFNIPEQWHYIEISGLDKKEVTDASSLFLITKNATAIQQEFAVTIRDIKMGKERLPEAVVVELAKQTPLLSGKILRENDAFYTFVLLETIAAQSLGTAEIYKRIEIALLEDKLQQSFDKWINKRREKSTITMANRLAKAKNIADIKETEINVEP